MLTQYTAPPMDAPTMPRSIWATRPFLGKLFNNILKPSINLRKAFQNLDDAKHRYAEKHQDQDGEGRHVPLHLLPCNILFNGSANPI